MIVTARADLTVHDTAAGYLTPGRDYLVLEFDDEYFRIVNDRCEPTLYPKVLFVIANDHIPSDWVRQDFADGEYRVGPEETSRPGFYEAYFDRHDDERATFDRVLHRIVSQCWPSGRPVCPPPPTDWRAIKVENGRILRVADTFEIVNAPGYPQTSLRVEITENSTGEYSTRVVGGWPTGDGRQPPSSIGRTAVEAVQALLDTLRPGREG
jgi:hypothetical protein